MSAPSAPASWVAEEIERAEGLLGQGEVSEAVRLLAEAERGAVAQGYPELLPKIAALADEAGSRSEGRAQRKARQLAERIEWRAWQQARSVRPALSEEPKGSAQPARSVSPARSEEPKRAEQPADRVAPSTMVEEREDVRGTAPPPRRPASAQRRTQPSSVPRAAWIALLLAVVLLFGPFLAIGVAFSNEAAGEAMFFALIPVACLALVFCLVGAVRSIGARSIVGVLMSLSPLPPFLLWLFAIASSA